MNQISMPHKKTQEATVAVSVIVAVQNQSKTIEWLDHELHQLMADCGQPCEVIYVDDGSTDTTWSILQRLQKQSSDTQLIKMRTAFGEGSVLEAALEHARGEKILFITARVGVQPRDLQKLLDKLDENVDVVIGVRHPRRDSYINRFVSWLFNTATNLLTKIHLRDINSGVIATRRDVLHYVPFYGALNTFIPVLAHHQGYRIAEVNVEQKRGQYAKSIHPRDYIRRLLDLVSVVFLSRYTKRPLHFLGFLGVIFTIVGAGIDIYLFFYRLLGIGGIAGRPMLLLGMVLLVIGLQMIAVGLLGEMIIFTHAREIREYNIEEIIG